MREHRFLVATDNVAYDWLYSEIWFNTRSGGNDVETHYPLGQFIDRFRADGSPGLLLLHAPGNVFIRDLADDQTICVQPTALLYKDPNVGMALHLEFPDTRGMSWRRYQNRNVWLRLWGPGRVAVQSVFERPETSHKILGSSPATQVQWTL